MHEVFAQGVIWEINSLDQWGMELGKELATTIIDELMAPEPVDPNHDASTNSLLRHYRTAREAWRLKADFPKPIPPLYNSPP